MGKWESKQKGKRCTEENTQKEKTTTQASTKILLEFSYKIVLTAILL